MGVGAQGPLLERGFDAVRISGSGELPPDGSGPVESVDEDRLGTLGRATLRTVTAVDQRARLEHGPETYLLAVSQVVPGWALALLAATLLLPALAVSVDALARARRRRVAVLPWMRWIGAWAAAFLCAVAMAELLALVGATPRAAARADAPAGHAARRRRRIAVLGGRGWRPRWRAACWRAAWRSRPEPALSDPTDPGAGVALALALVRGRGAALDR